MASTHTDMVALNEAVRLRLIQTGEVAADEHTVVFKHGRHRAERSVPVGDRLRFGRLDQEMGVVNGTLGVVDAIKSTAKRSFVLTLRLESNGRVVKLDTSTYGELDYAYARTVDKAQGTTVAEAYFLASVGRMDVHLSLVAATRYRDRFKMYATESDLESLQERLGVERLRVNALEEGQWMGVERV
jgi:ATP-dependent exoDNAse (exonuclease V) alpha subunit